MFYSKDLLSRKSPLGAIWTIAHGKKLSKTKLIGLSVQEICNQILNPDVPHSLRLQGILIGGVVVVFSRQQSYLLEDASEMMTRVKEAINLHDLGGHTNATLAGGTTKARVEAITLDEDPGDLDDLNNMLVALPTYMHHGQHILSLTQRQAFTPATPADEEDGLFNVPVMSVHANSTQPNTAGNAWKDDEVAFAGQGSKRQGSTKTKQGTNGIGSFGLHSRSTTAAAEVFEDQEELFDMDALMFDGLDGIPGLDPPLQRVEGGSPGGVNNTLSVDHRSASMGHLGSNANKRTATPTREDEKFEQDDGFFAVPLTAEQQRHVVDEMNAEFDAADREDLTEEGDELHTLGASAHGAKRALAGARQKRVGKRGKGARMVLDALEELQVPAKEFREWTLDTRELLVPRGLKRKSPSKTTSPAAAAAAIAAVMGIELSSVLARVMSMGPLATTLPGVPLCTVLQSFYTRACRPAALPSFPAPEGAEGSEHPTSGARKQRKRAAAARLEAGEDGAVLVEGCAEDKLLADMALEEAEFHDQLHDLPFGGDLEVERLRAGANTPVSIRDLDVLGSDALDSEQRDALKQALLRTGSRATSATTDRTIDHSGSFMNLTGPSMLVGGGRGSKGISSVGGRTTDGSSLPLMGSGHSPADRGLDMRWGNRTLDDLLPPMAEEGELDFNILREDEVEEVMGAGAGAWPARSSAGTVPGGVSPGVAGPVAGRRSMRNFTQSMPPLTALTPFQLVESSGLDVPGMQAPPSDPVMSKHTSTVLKIVRQRLSLQAAEGVEDPSVSFFGLVQQLKRAEAVKLFVQVLITQSSGHLVAKQAEAYGDIMLQAGIKLA